MGLWASSIRPQVQGRHDAVEDVEGHVGPTRLHRCLGLLFYTLDGLFHASCIGVDTCEVRRGDARGDATLVAPGHEKDH